MLYRGGEKAEFIEMLGKKLTKNADRSWRYHAAASCSSNLSPQLHFHRSECSCSSTVNKHLDLFMATRSTRKVTSVPQALQQVGSGPATRQLADWNQSSHKWNMAWFTCRSCLACAGALSKIVGLFLSVVGVWVLIPVPEPRRTCDLLFWERLTHWAGVTHKQLKHMPLFLFL